MKILFSFILVIVFTSCSIGDETSFSLVCNGTESIESSTFGKSNEPKSNTYNFKNKKLENYDCHTWTSEKIVCSLNSEPNSLLFHHSVINIDRVSGLISSGFMESVKTDKGQIISSSITRFNGKCEKVDKKKF